MEQDIKDVFEGLEKKLEAAESQRQKLADDLLKQEQTGLNDLEKRITAKLDETATKLKSDVQKEWDDKLASALGQTWRDDLGKVLDKWRNLKATIIGGLVAALLAGVTTVGVGGYLKAQIESIKSQAEALKTDAKSASETAKSQVDLIKSDVARASAEAYHEASAKLNEQLTANVEPKAILNRAVKDAERTIKETLEAELNVNTFTNLVLLLGGVEVTLETADSRAYVGGHALPGTEDLSASSRYVRGAMQIRELLYSVRALTKTYGPQLASGTVANQKRIALVYLLQGIVERAGGNSAEADRWFRYASTVDDRLPEAKILRARFFLEDQSYVGAGQFAYATLNDALALLESAHNSDPNNPECRLAKIDLLRLRGEYESAIQLVDEEIEREIKDYRDQGFLRDADARTYFLRGAILYRRYTKAKEHVDSDRMDAVAAFSQAVHEDPAYLKALNNVIWDATHRWDDSFVLSADPSSPRSGNATTQSATTQSATTQSATTQSTTRPAPPSPWGIDLSQLKERINAFATDPLVQKDPQLLNTLSEGYFALAAIEAPKNLRNALKLLQQAKITAQRAVDAARFYDLSQLDWCSKRFVEINRLSDELIKKTPISIDN